MILIDTGLGPKYHGHLLASLKLAGVSPREVTDVLITHPHPDHVGGLLDAQVGLAFPDATIGHVGYEIASGHARLLDMGDVAHSSIVSLARPRWPIEFDVDHALAGETREKTLTALALSGEWVFAPHFPLPGVGHVVTAGRGFAWKPGLP